MGKKRLKRAQPRAHKPEILERRIQIVLKAIDNARKPGEFGVVSFEDVKSLYDQYPGTTKKKARFRDDMDWLCSLEGIPAILEPLGFATPTMKIAADRNSITMPVRNFAKLLHPNTIGPKRRLAKGLMDAEVEMNGKVKQSKPLVSRSGGLYLGTGSTVYELAREIINRRDEFVEGFHVFSQNFEVATLFNSAAPRGHFTFSFPGATLDFHTGCVESDTPFPAHVDTAIIGIHNIWHGKLFTSEPQQWQTALKYLAVADSIVVVADKSKKKSGDGVYKMCLPDSTKGRVDYFVTDEHYEKQDCPEGLKHLLLNCGN